jgi:hypothetical protein
MHNFVVHFTRHRLRGATCELSPVAADPVSWAAPQGSESMLDSFTAAPRPFDNLELAVARGPC